MRPEQDPVAGDQVETFVSSLQNVPAAEGVRSSAAWSYRRAPGAGSSRAREWCPVLLYDPAAPCRGFPNRARFAEGGRRVVVVHLDHPVLRRAGELVGPVAQEGRVPAGEVSDPRHSLDEGPPIEILARHGGRLRKEIDLLTPALDRPLLLDVVVDVALGRLWIGLVPHRPAAAHPRVVATL